MVIAALCLTAARGQETKRILDTPVGDRPAVARFKEAQILLVRADEARDSGGTEEAARLYKEAWRLYISLAEEYPDWQPGVTRFRITYCDNQLHAIGQRNSGESPAFPPEEAGMTHFEPEDLKAALAEQEELGSLAATSAVLVASNRPGEALTTLMKGLNIDPDDVPIRIMMGIVHCHRGEYENAMHLMAALIEENRTNARAHVVLGAAYFGLGRLVSAEEQIRRALVLDPELSEAHYNLAQLSLAASPPDIARARRHYRLSLESGGSRDVALEESLR